MLPLVGVLTLVLLGGGGFLFTKFKCKQKEQSAAKPDPDADYVDDGEDFGYFEEDDDADFSINHKDTNPCNTKQA